MTTSQHDARTALIVVDMQNDFGHPDGSLFVEGGDTIVGAINDKIEEVAGDGGLVVLTQDWHPASTPHFIDDGGVWPTHCVAGTWGAELVDGLDPNHRASAVIRKGTNGEDGYSAFSMREPGGDVDIPTGLAGLLRERGVERVVVVGLATDVCVSATAQSAATEDFETFVVWDATRPVYTDADTHTRTIDELNDAGVIVIGSTS
ncbi:isochorismatase family protein [Ilumatobacter coccineus]|uniref:nicotinamidase n=1 Tax=Ilumatobacter coccineus (strain NBRC 103263 / KCTC 29153 / YM16-304) TaxID=1313172 RepID=A0A6C7EBX4_ILUCY|nr:isochorismatase family protein [Ilumatobacter coccineus]BAN04247.1 putative pyrazinamidase/nicotinamidase [Ilumatobacter coccineus YM16-304]